MLDKRQGIEHVVAPEQGFILPGMVIAAGDSHTTTYGALGAFGFGIGTSEIEHLLASQTLVYKRLKTMRVTVDGVLGDGADLQGHHHGADRTDRRVGRHRLRHRIRRAGDRCPQRRGAA